MSVLSDMLKGFPKGPNLTAQIVKVEDGIVLLHLRGGRGNPIVEKWQVYDGGRYGFGIHAERYTPDGDLIAEMDSLTRINDAVRFLTDGAWIDHKPESLTVYPARIDRAVHR
jgi:hypothetical protein